MNSNLREKNLNEKQKLVKNYLMTKSPYCILPQTYFEEVQDKDGLCKKKKMLSISSWDGREIFTLERSES